MNEYKPYTIQVEVEMHDGPSVNDVVTISAISEEDAMEFIENDAQDILDAIAEQHGGYDVVMCVTPQLAMEGELVSIEKWYKLMHMVDL